MINRSVNYVNNVTIYMFYNVIDLGYQPGLSITFKNKTVNSSRNKLAMLLSHILNIYLQNDQVMCIVFTG